MADRTLSLEMIEEFLSLKRIAVVGISREPKEFSVTLYEELCRRGYDVALVNPNASELMGRPCFPRVQDIRPPVEGVLLLTSPEVTETVVKDCAETGIGRVWMYRAAGKGAVSASAVEFCRERGIQVVAGQCPFMFWPDASAGHRFHGFIRKISGRYPRRTHETNTHVA